MCKKLFDNLYWIYPFLAFPFPYLSISLHFPLFILSLVLLLIVLLFQHHVLTHLPYRWVDGFDSSFVLDKFTKKTNFGRSPSSNTLKDSAWNTDGNYFSPYFIYMG